MGFMGYPREPNRGDCASQIPSSGQTTKAPEGDLAAGADDQSLFLAPFLK